MKGLDESIAMKSDRFTEEERASMLGSLSLYKDQSITKTMEKNGVDNEVDVVVYSSSSSELTDDEEEQDDGDIKDTDGTEEKNVEKKQEKNKNKKIKRRKKKKKKKNYAMDWMWVLDDDVEGTGWAFGGTVEGWCGWYPSAWIEKPIYDDTGQWEDATAEWWDSNNNYSTIGNNYTMTGREEGDDGYNRENGWREEEETVFEAVACAAFVGATDVELSFEEGALLEVRQRYDDVWWYGCVRSGNDNPQEEGMEFQREGYFPSSFVYITGAKSKKV